MCSIMKFENDTFFPVCAKCCNECSHTKIDWFVFQTIEYTPQFMDKKLAWVSFVHVTGINNFMKLGDTKKYLNCRVDVTRAANVYETRDICSEKRKFPDENQIHCSDGGIKWRRDAQLTFIWGETVSCSTFELLMLVAFQDKFSYQPQDVLWKVVSNFQLTFRLCECKCKPYSFIFKHFPSSALRFFKLQTHCLVHRSVRLMRKNKCFAFWSDLSLF